MQTAQDMFKKHLLKAQQQRANSNLTPAQKAKLTRRIKRLQQQLELA